MGVHIDGFPVLACNTFVVGAGKGDKAIKGAKADLITAAYKAAEVAIRLLKKGNENSAVTEKVGQVAAEYGVKPVEGILSFQIKRHMEEGEKQIILAPNAQQKASHPKCQFGENEVFIVDIVVSAGVGKIGHGYTKTTIFQKNNKNELLKLKTSRNVVNEVHQRFGHYFFHVK